MKIIFLILTWLCTIFGSLFEGEASHSVMNFEGMGNCTLPEKFISCGKLLPEERSKNCAQPSLSPLLPLDAMCTDAPPIAIYLTWREDPTTTMLIQWITKASDQASSVEYTIDGKESSWKKCVGTKHAFPDEKPYYVHVAALSQLTPDTLYRFRIEGCKTEHLFKTMPKSLEKPLRFVVGGDINLSNIALFDETTQQAIAHNPAFVVVGGDLACAISKKHSKENCEKWLALLSHWYANSQTDTGRIVPLLVAIGNHEVEGGMGQEIAKAPYFYTLFASPGPQGYMALRFSNYLALYILDSGHTHPMGGQQTAWLAAQMAKDRSMLHRCAVYHIPAYPDVRSYRNKESSAVRRHFVPVFDKYHLHLAFENHEHAYKKTLPLVNSSFDPNGTIYVGDGSWGVAPRSPKTASRTTYLEKTIAARSFSLVTISKNSRTVTEISHDGTVLDSFTQETDHVKAIRSLKETLALFKRLSTQSA